MKLIITIDTEEDNWDCFHSTSFTLENIKKIPELQSIFDEFGVKPTYLITYPVATDRSCVEILKSISSDDRCEIGTHCHPWNTPPYEEVTNSRNSMLCNLPPALQYRKLSTLHNAIIENFGVKPVSFRSGRWGYDKDVAENLHRLGYKVDTSINPYTNWKECHGPDFTSMTPEPFMFSVPEVFKACACGQMLEMPATIGFLQEDFDLCNSVLKVLSREKIRKLHLCGLLYRLNIINKVWLSPEVSNARQMIRLADVMRRKGYGFINMVFHSSSLKHGLTPFVKTEKDERAFFAKIREFLKYADEAGIESIKLSESLPSV